jgi:hypothetical protein
MLGDHAPSPEIDQDLRELSTLGFLRKYVVRHRQSGPSYVAALDVFDLPHVSDATLEYLAQEMPAELERRRMNPTQVSRPDVALIYAAEAHAVDLIIDFLNSGATDDTESKIVAMNECAEQIARLHLAEAEITR